MFQRVLQRRCWFAILGFVATIGCDQGVNPNVASTDTVTIQPVRQLDEKDRLGSEARNNNLVFEGFVVHKPVVHENLTIFPVSRVEPSLEDRFITLDEGLKNGTIEVFELSAGNTETVSNANPAAVPQISSATFFDESPAVHGNSTQSTSERLVNEETNAGTEPEQATQAIPVQRDEEVSENLSTANGDQATENAAGDFRQDPFEMHSEESLENSVNQVYVVNRSDRPLYLMPGEIILGGDQDRTIGEEIVVAPTGKQVKVEVFCVEHGRWEGRSAERTIQELATAVSNPTSAQSIAANLTATGDEASDASLDESARKLSEQAENGQFVASVGVLTKKARLAAQGAGDQGKVWDEVASANASASSQIDSGAFTQNYVHADNIKRFESFVEALQDQVAGTDNVVGVVVAVNGRIDAADIFESTPLFRKLWPKLLKSYALDAANRPGDQEISEQAEDLLAEEADENPATVSKPIDPQAQLVTCTMQDAVDFLQKAKAANETASDVTNGMTVAHRSDDSVDSFSLRIEEPNAAASGGGFGGGGLGGAVHFSGFSK